MNSYFITVNRFIVHIYKKIKRDVGELNMCIEALRLISNYMHKKHKWGDGLMSEGTFLSVTLEA